MPHTNREQRLLAAQEHYQKNKSRHRNQVRERRRELFLWLLELKRRRGCQDCGEQHPECLEFHHREPKHKDRDVSTMVRRGFSKENIEKEVDKCDLVCANCHRKRHFNPDTMSFDFSHHVAA